ncbi:ABC transporter substrate-binding protein [Tessaracoccus caeni]|uniref:ABC transporter substrate-binding protein n=1 Tax=Tessaracoccus caeni TaxID=3031239 RepID=UPI0023DCD416|nr:extracellular solute-binding protein [Tessaracoccus caeni]MDF1489581.1 extracellular solute-binding protein [Tessaracoccus caeni]
MQLSRRSLLLGGGGLAATATLAACGNNNPLDQSSTAPSTSGSASATGELPALSQWYHQYDEAGVKEAVEGYAAAYDKAKVSVNWVVSDYSKVLGAQLLTNDLPDVFEVEQGGSLDMIRAGQLADLTDLIEPHRSEFNEAVMNRFTFDGKVHGIPQTIDMQLLYYRPSLLKEAGVEPPTTFEELVAAINATKSADIGGLFAGNDGNDIGLLGTLLIWASGHDQLNAERTEAAFLTDDFYNALIAYRELRESGGILSAASAEWYSPDAMANGEAVFQWGGLWSLPVIQEALGDDIAALPFPAIGPKGRPAVPFGAFGACVAAKGPNVDAAKEFVKWLWIEQDEYQVDFSDSYGTHIPAKNALVPKATKLAEGPGADAARYVNDHGFANDIMWSGAVGEAFGAALSAVIRDGKDPKETFEPFGEQVVAELKNLNS